MSYRLMRLSKYYDALRTNTPFLKASLSQKSKILINILKFLDGYSKKALILENSPVTAQIEPTSKCNLKCEMCVRDKMGVPIGTMSFGNFKKILEKLGPLFKIHLSGQGEPFLNKELFRMIEFANKRGILTNISTNGTILTREIIKKICVVEIGEIAISVDSTKKQPYEQIRKGANFEKLLSNIRSLTYELKKGNKKTIVSIAIVILKENIDELPRFVELAKKLGVKKIIFQTIQTKEDYLKKYSKKTKNQTVSNFRERLNIEMKKARDLADKHKILLIFDEEKSSGCIWPWRSIYITWNGYVTPCCKILDYRNPMIGNLLREDFWKIWNSKEYQMFRKLLKERKAPRPCKGCNMV